MPRTGCLCYLAFLSVVLLALPGARGEQAAPVEERTPSDVNQRLTNLERLLGSRGLLDMLSQLESLQKEMQRLRGEIEVQTHTLGQMQQRQRDLYTDLDKRLQRIEAGGVGSTASGVPAAEPGAQTTAGPPAAALPPAATATSQVRAGKTGETPQSLEVAKQAPTEPPKPGIATPPATASEAALAEGDPAAAQAAYQQAFTLLKQGRYEQAVTAFNEFLATYPKSANGDNAQYWLAESYYVLRRFEQAIVEYQKLVVNYPDSQKLTHSMLKIGYSYYELGQMDQARTVLEDLKTRYPGTTAARLAEERLQRMKLVQQ
ncbi:MAG: tol-pal system protein YbgF [Gammaproteobacteria bacterium]|nr:tol-pal system protein YbgF [Gammaproteobacteria bacterium]MCI0590791.1 tol-pal system protein YbgF [Gammaproteobacteria bacterium]